MVAPPPPASSSSSDDAFYGERPLHRVVLHLNPLLAQLLGTPTVYEDEALKLLTEKGLITAVSRDGAVGGTRYDGRGNACAPQKRSGGGGGGKPAPQSSVGGALALARAAPGKILEKKAGGVRRQASGMINSVAAAVVRPPLTARDRWRLAVKHTKEMAKMHSFDPWWNRNLHELRSELCVRYDYDPETKAGRDASRKETFHPPSDCSRNVFVLRTYGTKR